MSSNYDAMIRERMDTIQKLRRLKADVDPASGLAVSVRRGVVRDNEDDEYDHERRPWIPMETSVNMQKILDLLIEEQLASLRFWVKSGKEYNRALDVTLGIGQGFLDSTKQ